MSEVFVAVGGWNHEGFDDPIGAFTTEEAARKAIADGYKGYDCLKIFVCQLNSTDEPREIICEKQS